MGRKRDKQFWQSLLTNSNTYRQYFNRLMELSMSMFEWKNLPDTMDARYLELGLFENGSMVVFEDEVMGLLNLNVNSAGNFDCYGNPIMRQAYSRYNGYIKDLTPDDSVVIWNNALRTNSILDVQMFALRLYNLDRIIDTNVNAQKTPVMILADEAQRMTMLNLYKEYDGNQPFIFGSKDLDLKNVTSLNTGAPYISDKIQELKAEIWNEALTYLGISNVGFQKRERMVSDEVNRLQGGAIASRYSRLSARETAVKQINDMFGTKIEVHYREDYDTTQDAVDYVSRETLESGVNEDE